MLFCYFFRVIIYIVLSSNFGFSRGTEYVLKVNFILSICYALILFFYYWPISSVFGCSRNCFDKSLFLIFQVSVIFENIYFPKYFSIVSTLFQFNFLSIRFSQTYKYNFIFVYFKVYRHFYLWRFFSVHGSICSKHFYFYFFVTHSSMTWGVMYIWTFGTA